MRAQTASLNDRMAPLTKPPLLSAATIVAHVTKYFPFRKVEEGSVRELVSYDDRNFYFCGVLEGTAAVVQPFVFKVNYAEMNPELVEGLNAIMNHVHSRKISCPVPLYSWQGSQTVVLPHADLLRLPDEQSAESHVNQSGNAFCIRVLAYIGGECAVTCKMGPDLLFDIGAFVGNLDHVLASFSHPVTDVRVYDWDIKHFLSMRECIGLLNDAAKRHLAETVCTEVGNNLIPRLKSLKHSTIHGDCNEQNILIDPSTGRVCGIVDFGDCLRTCRVFELAILLAYCMLLVTADPIEMVAPVVAGYLSVFPLEQEELDVVYYAVLARLCKSVMSGYLTYLQDPSNPYVLTTQTAGWATIETLLRVPKHVVDKVWFGGVV